MRTTWSRNSLRSLPLPRRLQQPGNYVSPAFKRGRTSADFNTDDRGVATWYEEHRKEIAAKIDLLKVEATAVEVAALVSREKEGGWRGIRRVLEQLPVGEREEVSKDVERVDG